MSLVGATAVVGEVPRPLQAELETGRSYPRVSPLAEFDRCSDPWSSRLQAFNVFR